MRVLHLDTAMHWGAGQNQVRLLMRELHEANIPQLCVTPAHSQLEGRLRTEDLPVHGVPHCQGPGLLFTRAAIRLARGVDVVHAHTAGALATARWVARVRAVPIVVACRTLELSRPGRWNDVDRVIAVSAAVQDALTAEGVHPDRIRQVHSGVDLEEIQRLSVMVPALRDRLGFEPDRFLVGAVGSLHGFRNQRLVPQAAARLRDVAWTVIGEGPERVAIEAAVAAHGVGDNVRLVASVADPRTALLELDVLVSPTEGEALGTSLLEAMALDVPVVAADDSGPAEILRPVHEQTGVSLFPPGDAGALAERVRRLQQDAGLRKSVAAIQRQRLEAFRIQKTAAATLAVYAELVEAGE